MGKFHDPIKQRKLKSFKELSKSMKVKTKQGIKEMKMNPEIIFRTLLTVLSVPTGGAPLSMFHDDGSMRKPTRADWLMCWRRVSCPQHHGQRVTLTSLYILWTSCCFCVKHLHNTTASRLVSSLITFWHTLCDNSHMHTLLFLCLMCMVRIVMSRHMRGDDVPQPHQGTK